MWMRPLVMSRVLRAVGMVVAAVEVPVVAALPGGVRRVPR